MDQYPASCQLLSLNGHGAAKWHLLKFNKALHFQLVGQHNGVLPISRQPHLMRSCCTPTAAIPIMMLRSPVNWQVLRHKSFTEIPRSPPNPPLLIFKLPSPPAPFPL